MPQISWHSGWGMMFCSHGSLEYMFWSGHQTSTAQASPWHNTSALFPHKARLECAATYCMAKPRYSDKKFVCFMGMMGGAETWALRPRACSLRWCAHVPNTRMHELGASAADMAQHLVQPKHLSHYSYIPVLEEVVHDRSQRTQ
jgi:hypothetical protein